MSLNNEELENLSPKERVPPLPYTPNDAQQEANTANAIAMQGPILVPLPAAGTGAYIVQPTPYVLPMVIGNQMGPKPASITCPSCKEVIVTTIKTRPNTGTHMCAMMFCFMCFWPCAVIPYFVDKCQNLDHYCPHCSSYIGSYLY